MTRTYGGDGTIHQTAALNVELDEDGKVVSVWFRCQPVAFTQHPVDERRANEMREMYKTDAIPGLVEIELAEWV